MELKKINDMLDKAEYNGHIKRSFALDLFELFKSIVLEINDLKKQLADSGGEEKSTAKTLKLFEATVHVNPESIEDAEAFSHFIHGAYSMAFDLKETIKIRDFLTKAIEQTEGEG